MAKHHGDRKTNKPAGRRSSTGLRGGTSARQKPVYSYQVTWEIELDAESPLDAAEKALKIMQDTASLAVCFSVTRGGQRHIVDLKADDAPATVLDLKTNKKALHCR